MPEALIKELGERLGLNSEQVLEQAIQFAYANAHMENSEITVEMIREFAATDVRV